MSYFQPTKQPRSHASPISRSKAGCTACRRRRRKCDEAKPRCGSCLAKGTQCTYVAVFEFRDATRWAADRVAKYKGTTAPTVPSPPAALISSFIVQAGASDRPTADPAAGASPGRNLTNSEGDTGRAHSDVLAATCNITPDLDHHHLEPAADDPLAPHSAGLICPGPSMAMAISGDQTVDLDMRPAAPSRFDRMSPSCSMLTPNADIWQLTNSTSDSAGPTGVGDLHHSSCFTAPHPLREVNDCSDAAGQEGNCFDDEPYPILFSHHSHSHNHIDGLKTPTSLSFLYCPPNHGDSGSCDPGSNLAVTSTSPDSLSFSLCQPASLTLSETSIRHPPDPTNLTPLERLYLAHFVVHVADKVPGHSGALKSLTMGADSFRFAAMALAAASLANLQGAQAIGPGPCGRPAWVPSACRLDDAKALHTRARLSSQSDSTASAIHTLFAELLLAWYEAELCPVSHLRRSVKNIEDMILDNWDEIASSRTGSDFVRASSYLRAFVRPTDCISGPLNGESSREDRVNRLIARAGSLGQVVALLASEACAISSRIILNRVISHGCALKSDMNVIKKICQWHWIMQGNLRIAETDLRESEFDSVNNEERCLEEMDAIHQQLEAHGRLCFSEVLEVASSQQLTDVDFEHIEPLQFNSYEESMRCATYAYACIMSDTSLLRAQIGWGPPTDPDACHGTARAVVSQQWLAVLVRTAAALEPQECARLNTYRVGITNMLLAAILRCQDLRPLSLLEAVLARMASAGAPCEDLHFPLPIARLCIKRIREYEPLHRRVFLATSTFHAATEKHELWAEQSDNHILLHGRGPNGSYFTDVVGFGEP